MRSKSARLRPNIRANFRSHPAIESGNIQFLLQNQELLTAILPGQVEYGDRKWQYARARNKYGWIDQTLIEFLSARIPPHKFGLHVHVGSANPKPVQDLIIQMIETGWVSSVLIIMDIGFANRCKRAGCPYVTLRLGTGIGDMHKAVTGTRADIDEAVRAWREGDLNQKAQRECDRGIYIIPWGHNEINYAFPLHPGWWYLGLQQAMGDDQRGTVIFNYGVGQPWDLRIENGVVTSKTWSAIVDTNCMREGKQRDNLCGLHQYGVMIPLYSPAGDYVGSKETNEPGSAYYFDPQGNIIKDDTEGAKWFGFRHDMIWRNLIPPDHQMKILVGECGASASHYEGIGGAIGVLNDMKGYSLRYANDPWVVGYCYWTIFGGRTATGESAGFEFSTIDPMLPLAYEWLLEAT